VGNRGIERTWGEAGSGVGAVGYEKAHPTSVNAKVGQCAHTKQNEHTNHKQDGRN